MLSMKSNRRLKSSQQYEVITIFKQILVINLIFLKPLSFWRTLFIQASKIKFPMTSKFYISILFLLTLLLVEPSYSSTYNLTKGSSLSVQDPNDVLLSPKGTFSVGFYPIGNNSFCFAIWLTERMHDGSLTMVWTANRDNPVNGKRSKLTLMKNGNLILTDACEFIVWATQTSSNSSVELSLKENGNLVLHDLESRTNLWESFNFPTDTLLADQPLTRQTRLVSSRSLTNHSSGFYKLNFDDENILHLVFDGIDVSSVYWPNPWFNSWENGRSSYNNTRTAFFNSSGYFQSTDNFGFNSSDYGSRTLRRLTMDIDGNIRMYSLKTLNKKERTWMVTWQAIQQPCKIHGICGANALCTYVPHERKSGRKCTCLPGYKMNNHTDWAYGCKEDFSPVCKKKEDNSFLELSNTEFYGYDISYLENSTLPRCKIECLNKCDCSGFQFKMLQDKGISSCYVKSLLVNGYRSPEFRHPMYIKLPKFILSSWNKDKTPAGALGLYCSHVDIVTLDRSYKIPTENETLQFMVWFATSIGVIEFFLFFIGWWFIYRTQNKSNPDSKDYLQVGSGFKRFAYDELKKATGNFSEEIGRGSGGVVYKGLLSDHRVAAIKRLNEANQGEAEFMAEISTIGQLNHMNLIEMWGYCVERKHRLLVYEYRAHGSLANNLTLNTLDSEKRFNIAVGTARGLAYLHDECLEWVLHCDVKPQNVLLDGSFQPKVADFGLSKLFNRTGGNYSNFSKIRGTRGYMAPEWIFNLAITSKVDVYSYGVVVLEMVTGKSPMGAVGLSGVLHMEQRGLVNWVRMSKNKVNRCALEEIIDPKLEGKYDEDKMELLVEVALQCVEEDKDARPTMRRVMERLMQSEE